MRIIYKLHLIFYRPFCGHSTKGVTTTTQKSNFDFYHYFYKGELFFLLSHKLFYTIVSQNDFVKYFIAILQ